MGQNVRVQIPDELWRQVRPEAQVVYIRLYNGEVMRDLAVNEAGEITGKFVGGHSGIEASALGFQSSNIAAIQSRVGIGGQLGLRRWVER